MNLNGKIKELEGKTGYPVEADIYTGAADKYITFTYEDERPVYAGNNRALADEAYLQISFFCPSNFNYFETKHLIRDHLEDLGFKVSIRSWLEDDLNQETNKIRRVLFEARYTETRKRGI